MGCLCKSKRLISLTCTLYGTTFRYGKAVKPSDLPGYPLAKYGFAESSSYYRPDYNGMAFRSQSQGPGPSRSSTNNPKPLFLPSNKTSRTQFQSYSPMGESAPPGMYGPDWETMSNSGGSNSRLSMSLSTSQLPSSSSFHSGHWHNGMMYDNDSRDSFSATNFNNNRSQGLLFRNDDKKEEGLQRSKSLSELNSRKNNNTEYSESRGDFKVPAHNLEKFSRTSTPIPATITRPTSSHDDASPSTEEDIHASPTSALGDHLKLTRKAKQNFSQEFDRDSKSEDVSGLSALGDFFHSTGDTGSSTSVKRSLSQEFDLGVNDDESVENLHKKMKTSHNEDVKVISSQSTDESHTGQSNGKANGEIRITVFKSHSIVADRSHSIAADQSSKDDMIKKSYSLYKCDFCHSTSRLSEEMQEHLVSSTHASASLYNARNTDDNCIQLLSIDTMFAVTNKQATGKPEDLGIYCPKCHRLFQDIFSCSVHCRHVHHLPTGLYCISPVVDKKSITISTEPKCLTCKSKFQSHKALHAHWRKTKSHFPEATSRIVNEPTIKYITAPCCDAKFQDLIAAKMHAVQHKRKGSVPGPTLTFQVTEMMSVKDEELPLFDIIDESKNAKFELEILMKMEEYFRKEQEISRQRRVKQAIKDLKSFV